MTDKATNIRTRGQRNWSTSTTFNRLHHDALTTANIYGAVAGSGRVGLIILFTDAIVTEKTLSILEPRIKRCAYWPLELVPLC